MSNLRHRKTSHTDSSTALNAQVEQTRAGAYHPEPPPPASSDRRGRSPRGKMASSRGEKAPLVVKGLICRCKERVTPERAGPKRSSENGGWRLKRSRKLRENSCPSGGRLIQAVEQTISLLATSADVIWPCNQPLILLLTVCAVARRCCFAVHFLSSRPSKALPVDSTARPPGDLSSSR